MQVHGGAPPRPTLRPPPPPPPPSCPARRPELGQRCGADDRCLNRELLIECCAASCPAGDACHNRRLQRGAFPRTRWAGAVGPPAGACLAAGCLRQPPLHARSRPPAELNTPAAAAAAPRSVAHLGAKGWGLLAAEPLAPGALVAEYCGEVLAPAEAEARAQRYQAAGLAHTYLMTAGPGEVIDATARGSAARFANHSCEPSCGVEQWSVRGRTRMALVARRAVAAGGFPPGLRPRLCRWRQLQQGGVLPLPAALTGA
jgi:hypothetical protein